MLMRRNAVMARMQAQRNADLAEALVMRFGEAIGSLGADRLLEIAERVVRCR